MDESGFALHTASKRLGDSNGPFIDCNGYYKKYFIANVRVCY